MSWCVFLECDDQLLGIRGCLKPEVDSCLLALSPRRMIHFVPLLFPSKEDLSNKWTRPLLREHSTSVKRFDYTRSASLVCLSRFITNFSCTFVTQETEGSLFQACHPPSPQKASCVFFNVGRTWTVYVWSYTRTQFLLFFPL